jgi:sec-independent protein translocase protein TatB
MAGTLLGRAQRYISDVKAEVSKEIELEELRKMQKDVQEAAQNVDNCQRFTAGSRKRAAFD